jgi:hypothetical protein
MAFEVSIIAHYDAQSAVERKLVEAWLASCGGSRALGCLKSRLTRLLEIQASQLRAFTPAGEDARYYAALAKVLLNGAVAR